jgi:hypothetical protein
MFLVSTILGLPLAPVRGVIKLGELLQQQAEEQLYSSASVRRRLEELGEAVAAGEITPEEERRRASELLGRVVESPAVRQPGATRRGGEEG